MIEIFVSSYSNKMKLELY